MRIEAGIQGLNSRESAIGRGRGIRTPDILLPKQARYQTALYPDSETRLRNRRTGIIRLTAPAVN